MYEDILVSVIMAVHDEKEEYLKESIGSILHQTHKNLEFIIIDDYSNEYTQALLGEIDDSRVHLHRNSRNLGLTKSLNIALSLCKGKYIARMDADDISYETRIEKQLKYMENNYTVGVVGCWTGSNKDSKVAHWHGSVSSDWRRVAMMFGNFGVCHPSAFIRKSILDDNGIIYDEEIKKAQDYDLWIQMLKVSDMMVYPEVLLMYRIHEKQITNESRNEQIFWRNYIQKKYIKNILKTDDETAKQILLLHEEKIDIKSVKMILEKVEKIAERNDICIDYNIVKREVTRLWIEEFAKKEKNIKKIILNKLFMQALNPTYIAWRVKLYGQMKIK